MNYSIIFTHFFKREFKQLSKKYLSLKVDLQATILLLNDNPQIGESVGNNCYKVRMAISSKKQGKSGGARIITYIRFVDQEIYLLAIYDKSDLSTLTEKQISERIKKLK